MFRIIFSHLLLWQFVIAFVSCDCDPLNVHTKSGPVRGVLQQTYVQKKPYISFKGIPYAQPPIGPLRFAEPLPVSPWKLPLITTDKYQNACTKIAQSMVYTDLTNVTYSEDCLYLNVYTPVLRRCKNSKKKKVIVFFPGGAFTEGEGNDRYYGPDFIIEDNVVLVTVNYRVGPFGFFNFNRKGYTGNMGFKDQREALRWVKRNIKYFGGDPNAITLMGQSAGSVSTHLHVLGSSCKYINRAIMLSGTTLHYWSIYKGNHYDLFREALKDELGSQNSDEDIFNFMMNPASTEVIIAKTPFLGFGNGLLFLYWTAVIEDVHNAINPILTKTPREIYAANHFSKHCRKVEVVFGVTSAEYPFFMDPRTPYSWVPGVQSVSGYAQIGIPYQDTTLTDPTNEEYRRFQVAQHDYFFGENANITETPDRLNQYIQLASDGLFVIGFYEAINFHSRVSPTFCTHFNISLNTNIIKKSRQWDVLGVEGALHVDDIGYIFKSEAFAEMYDQTLANTDLQTFYAWYVVSRLYTGFAKTGLLGKAKAIKSTKNAKCIDINNELRLNLAEIPRKKAMTEFWKVVGGSQTEYKTPSRQFYAVA